MGDIKPYVDQIKNAVYGEEVRASMVNALNIVNDDNNKQQALRDEVVHARDDMRGFVADFDGKVNGANTTKQQLVDATNNANTSKDALDKSIVDSGTAKTTLDEAVRVAGTSKTELDQSNTTAGQTKTALDKLVKDATALDTNLGTKIQDGEKLKTDLPTLVTSEKKKITDEGTAQTNAVNKAGNDNVKLVTDEGTKQLNIVNQASAGIVADRQQIQKNTQDVTTLKEDLTKLDNKCVETQTTTYSTDVQLTFNTPFFNNINVLKVNIKKGTSYTIKIKDASNITSGTAFNLYEKDSFGKTHASGAIAGNNSNLFVASVDVEYINLFIEAKNIVKNGIITIEANITKINKDSIESLAKGKVDSGYKVRKGNIFELGSVTGNNEDITRARSMPILGVGKVSIKNVTKNGYILTIRVWADKPFGTMEYDSGWKTFENLIEYDVTNKYYSIGICHADYTSTVDLQILNSLGIKIYEKLSNDTDEIVEDIHKRLNSIETAIPMFTSATVKNVAHRGDDIIAPQNTAPAYIEARKRGFTIAENDIAISKDGIYVTWHDVNLARLGTYLKDINGYDMYTNGTEFYWKDNVSGKIYTYTNDYSLSNVNVSTLTRCKGTDYSVETLPYSVLSRIDFGSYISAKFKGTKILTFEEWVLLCKQLGMEIYIDKKFSYSDKNIEDLYSIVKKHGMLNKATWLDPLFDKLRSLDPSARMCTLTHPTEQNITQFQKYNTGRGFFFNGDGKTVTRESVQLGLNAGFEVEVWYVDYGAISREQILGNIRKAVNYGCTGISTDHYTVADAFSYLLN